MWFCLCKHNKNCVFKLILNLTFKMDAVCIFALSNSGIFTVRFVNESMCTRWPHTPNKYNQLPSVRSTFRHFQSEIHSYHWIQCGIVAYYGVIPCRLTVWIFEMLRSTATFASTVRTYRQTGVRSYVARYWANRRAYDDSELTFPTHMWDSSVFNYSVFSCGSKRHNKNASKCPK